MGQVDPKYLPSATAEIDDSGNRVIIRWGGFYDAKAVVAMRGVPTATFKSADKSEFKEAYWYVQLRLDYMRELRAQWGDKLTLGPKLRKWGKRQVSQEKKLLSIQTQLWADLPVLQDGTKHEKQMFEALWLGPRGPSMTAAERKEALAADHGSFQTADVRFMADCANPLNANQPGTGKTLETIACTFEAKLQGPRLVIAQKSALETVWQEHLEHWQPYPVLLAMGDAANKRRVIQQAMEWAEWEEPFWLVCNIEAIRYNGIYKENAVGKRELVGVEWPFEEIPEIPWDVVIVDEFHKIGLNNTETLASKTLYDIPSTKKIDLSGTPMGGQPIKLYSVLHHLEPKEFSSKWNFAKLWLEVTPGDRSLEIGDVREDKQAAFAEMLSRYMVRRLKKEVLPWLPEKNHINLWVHMDERQKEQYELFAEDAEIRIEEENLTAAGILAEYTRLRQFAGAVQRLERRKVWDPKLQEHVEKIFPYPTEESCKLPEVMRILGELGIERGERSGEGVLIFSQFTKLVDMVHGYLVKQGIRADKLTGDTSQDDRKRLQKEFKEGHLDVVVLNTMAGGTSLNDLQRADTIIFLDQTWNPDDQEQASDRGHRGDKTTQVNVYWIKTKDTIEEYIERINMQKEDNNFNILDARRMGLRGDHAV